MARYIKPNHSTRTPTNILVVDTETRAGLSTSPNEKGQHELFLGCAVHIRIEKGVVRNKTWHMFRTRKQFWELVAKCQSEKHPLTIYSHNAGFDATICGYWEMVRSDHIKIKYAVTESPPTILVGWYNGMLLRWYDSMNWFRTSIEKIGNSIGMPKAKMPE